MALVQAVQNGKFVDTSASGTSVSREEVKSGSELNKNDFLQLLVAQMKYQDPLEPQSNTEYVSQLATFTQVEATENMSTTMNQMEANNLVGKYVIMKVTSSATGETNYVSGPVDYVMREGSKIYLAINENLYNLEDLDTVADSDYMEAATLTGNFSTMVSQMPSASQITLADEENVKALRKIYTDMTDYQKSFVSQEDLAKLTEVETKLAALHALMDAVDSDKKPADKENAENETATEQNPTIENEGVAGNKINEKLNG